VEPRLKRAFLDGAQDARSAFGVNDDAEPADKPSMLRKALPFLAAGGAGLAGYKLLRRPSFSTNPALREIQELAQRKGFHRVVDVTPYTPGSSFGERLEHFVTPQAGPSGDLNLWNKIKLLAREGTTDAIPVSQVADPRTPTGLREHVSGHRGPKKVEGVVWGRQNISGSNIPSAVRGGKDLEGDAATQKVMDRLSRKGKAFEAHLIQQHAPGMMPETHTIYSGKSLADIGHGIQGQDPHAAVHELQQRVLAQHGPDYMLKPSLGLASGVGGGGFPRVGGDDWATHLKAYTDHMADPGNRAAYEAAETAGGNASSHYLRSHDIYKGHVLNEALAKPESMLIQKLIPNVRDEYRVHTIAGSAPKSILLPRGYEGMKGTMKAQPVRLGVGKQSKEVSAFTEDLMRKLPPEYRQGNFAVDVVSHELPNGEIGLQAIELNPTEGAKPTEAGGGSGYLPWIGHRQYHAVTGRHTPLIAGLGGLGAATGAGIAAKHLSDSDDDRSQ
jgi:hypothetical protein